MTIISDGLFYGCNSLESLEIPGSVFQLRQSDHNYRNDTFYGCSNLRKLRLSFGTEELITGAGSGGFLSSGWKDWTNTIRELYIDRALKYDIPVPNLEKLEIGESVNTVQVKRIAELDKLTSIYSYALVPPALPTMTNKQYMDVKVYVPEEAIEAYKNADSWKNFWNLAPLSSSGIDNIEADSDAPTRIYTINGIEVTDKESLPSGIYIMRQGSKSRKFVVK